MQILVSSLDVKNICVDYFIKDIDEINNYHYEQLENSSTFILTNIVLISNSKD